MPFSAVLLSRFLNILLLIPGEQCLSQFNHFTTASSNTLPVNLDASTLASNFSPVTRPSTPLNINFQSKTYHAKRRLHYPPLGHGGAVLLSVTPSQPSITLPLQPFMPVQQRRGLIGDLFNSISSNFGLQSSAPSKDITLAQRQVNQSPQSLVSENRLASTSKLPTPTPAAIPNSSNDSSKSRLPTASSTTITNVKGTTSNHTWSTERTSSAHASQPSQLSSSKRDFPQTSLQKVGSYFKSSNRMAPLAYVVSIGFAFALLVTFVSLLKCVCHRKRFANTKDYPEGFPWAAPNGEPEGGESRNKGLLSRTPSYISNRNSITASLNFSRGPMNAESRANSYYVEYQLNDLRSPSDIDAQYPYTLEEIYEKDLEKDLSHSPDGLTSASSTEESSGLPSLSPSLDQKPGDDRWDMRSTNGTCLVLRPGANPQEHVYGDIIKPPDA